MEAVGGMPLEDTRTMRGLYMQVAAVQVLVCLGRGVVSGLGYRFAAMSG